MYNNKEVFDRIIQKQLTGRSVVDDPSYIGNLYDTLSGNYSYKLFQIIDNKLFVKSKDYPLFEGRFEGVKAHILKLLSKYTFPDMEFVYFDGDSLNSDDKLILQSASCRETSKSILLPDWSFQFWPETYLFDYGSDLNKILDRSRSIGIDIDGWRSKDSVVFMRASMNNRYREEYLNDGNDIFLDTKHVQLLNVPPGVPNFDITSGIDRSENSKYKFLLHLNGGLDADYSSGFRFRLACCSLVFYATNSKQREWWTDDEIFKEGEHYIQVTSKSDLRDKFNYYMDNEIEAHRIARCGFDFVEKYLHPDSVELYYKEMLLNYSGLIKYKVELSHGSIRIESYRKNMI